MPCEPPRTRFSTITKPPRGTSRRCAGRMARYCPVCGSRSRVKPTTTPNKAHGTWYHCGACRRRFELDDGDCLRAVAYPSDEVAAGDAPDVQQQKGHFGAPAAPHARCHVQVGVVHGDAHPRGDAAGRPDNFVADGGEGKTAKPMRHLSAARRPTSTRKFARSSRRASFQGKEPVFSSWSAAARSARITSPASTRNAAADLGSAA